MIIGVAGGSGSGKTTVVREIVRRLGPDQVSVIEHDSYYFDRSDVPPAARHEINYDHPDALETTLFVEHLEALLDGRPVEIPVYDFTHHARLAQTTTVEPRKVVIVEGILHQYLRTVRPMHLDFVEPSRRHADVIIPEGGHNTVGVDMLIARIQAITTARTER
jgi:uridine kinase